MNTVTVSYLDIAFVCLAAFGAGQVAMLAALWFCLGLSQRRNRDTKVSLARANGRGSAGECPACHCAKTPASRERAIRLADSGGMAADGHGNQGDLPRGTSKAAVGGGVGA